ncbi:MAG: ACP phosphodiesterase [Saprospiraceae bacterium]
MNHLAHCILSYPDEQSLIGNFIGDYIKGNDWLEYPPDIAKGMLVHRAIDSFTDFHPSVRESVHRVRPFAKRYSSPVVDVLYDHLVFLNWDQYHQVSFEAFAQWTYDALDAQREWMPADLLSRWPHMLQGQFLHKYAQPEGLNWVLEQFSKRLKGAYQPEELSDYFFAHLDSFHADFHGFYPELLDKINKLEFNS